MQPEKPRVAREGERYRAGPRLDQEPGGEITTRIAPTRKKTAQRKGRAAGRACGAGGIVGGHWPRPSPSTPHDAARRAFAIRPRGLSEAIARALSNEDNEFAETRWSDALSTRPPTSWGGQKFGSRLVDSRSAQVPVSPEVAFRPIHAIGGTTGWYYADWLWRLRGLLDLAVGGAGMRRGRRDPRQLRVGDTVDFWRVERFEPGRLLRLAAEMKLPGRAWLQFEVQGNESGSTIRQTAIFDPVGVPGLAYWYGLYPIHQRVFAGMLRGIARASEAAETSAQTSSETVAN